MRILCIDLAVDAKKTGAVALEPAGAGWAVEPRPTTDDDLVHAAEGADLVAVDVPLGWPTAFVEAVTAHHTGGPWTGTTERRALTHRTTDDVVRREFGAHPLSVSADRLGSAAMRGALLQHRWATEVWFEAVPRDGTGRLVEAYPAAALKVWGLDGAKYKNTTMKESGIEARRRILGEVEARVPWLDLGAARDASVASDDVLDAVVCVLIGVAHAGGATHGPHTMDERQAAEVEGWIHVPTVALEDLRPPR